MTTYFSNFDTSVIWDDCDHSVTNYIGPTPTADEIAAIEKELGYKLPAAYIALMQSHNGGILSYNSINIIPAQDQTSGGLDITGIMSIGHTMRYSLGGYYGSKFWMQEWGYPDTGIYFGTTGFGGHALVMLDYSTCGPAGEPAVVYMDQEWNFQKTLLAKDFETFIQSLTPFPSNP
ncbi:SUKH superfamily protein [Chitinophaga dinghuensis]|uniref:SUKH superfamily protein n=1 Tax=Chitinophaga dinghuensis TaxID=1539050 RepID=A0A327VY48_9BACT|nr:SMI1/KNR4 family protein [Chitinophaga dinghuensis]RAJ81917.1 SUKH superfamily protein [Chitinophaga dinghuensis]